MRRPLAPPRNLPRLRVRQLPEEQPEMKPDTLANLTQAAHVLDRHTQPGLARAVADARDELERLTDLNRRYANRIANDGHALQAVLDEHVTPRAQKLAAIHELAEMIADHYGDAWDHTPLCLNEPGCPLCGILAASENP